MDADPYFQLQRQMSQRLELSGELVVPTADTAVGHDLTRRTLTRSASTHFFVSELEAAGTTLLVSLASTRGTLKQKLGRTK